LGRIEGVGRGYDELAFGGYDGVVGNGVGARPEPGSVENDFVVSEFLREEAVG
jgi:hypothetical protein